MYVQYASISPRYACVCMYYINTSKNADICFRESKLIIPSIGTFLISSARTFQV